MSRADISPYQLEALPDFYLYVDEFQSFANKSFADILSEARKYRLNLTLAHQYIEQMEEEVSAAVFGNVGTMAVFRVGAFDAEVLEKEFAPQMTAEDLVNLGIFQVYLKLMIDGVTSQPFSATTLPPIARPLISYRNDIIESSRKQFARPRAIVEEEIKIWHEPIKPAPPAPKEPTAAVTPAGASAASAPRKETASAAVPERVERSERPPERPKRREQSMLPPTPRPLPPQRATPARPPAFPVITAPRASMPPTAVSSAPPALRPPERPIPLARLRPASVSARGIGRGDPTRNLLELRKALSDVLKKEPPVGNGPDGMPKEKVHTPGPASVPPPRPQPTAPKSAPSPSRAEIPEEELRALFDFEKPLPTMKKQETQIPPQSGETKQS